MSLLMLGLMALGVGVCVAGKKKKYEPKEEWHHSDCSGRGPANTPLIRDAILHQINRSVVEDFSGFKSDGGFCNDPFTKKRGNSYYIKDDDHRDIITDYYFNKSRPLYQDLAFKTAMVDDDYGHDEMVDLYKNVGVNNLKTKNSHSNNFLTFNKPESKLKFDPFKSLTGVHNNIINSGLNKDNDSDNSYYGLDKPKKSNFATVEFSKKNDLKISQLNNFNPIGIVDPIPVTKKILYKGEMCEYKTIPFETKISDNIWNPNRGENYDSMMINWGIAAAGPSYSDRVNNATHSNGIPLPNNEPYLANEKMLRNAPSGYENRPAYFDSVNGWSFGADKSVPDYGRGDWN